VVVADDVDREVGMETVANEVDGEEATVDDDDGRHDIDDAAAVTVIDRGTEWDGRDCEDRWPAVDAMVATSARMSLAFARSNWRWRGLAGSDGSASCASGDCGPCSPV